MTEYDLQPFGIGMPLPSMLQLTTLLLPNENIRGNVSFYKLSRILRILSCNALHPMDPIEYARRQPINSSASNRIRKRQATRIQSLLLMGLVKRASFRLHC